MEHDHPLAVTIVINSDEPITMHHEIGVPTSELTKAHDKKLLNTCRLNFFPPTTTYLYTFHVVITYI